MHGAERSILRANGPPEQPYPGNWKVCAAAEGFVAYMEALAHRIAQYGTAGIFFDWPGMAGASRRRDRIIRSATSRLSRILKKPLSKRCKASPAGANRRERRRHTP